MLVADVDTEEAAVLFMGLAGEMPDTAIAETPNGLHLWFLAPGFDANQWLGGRKLLFKGFGGYVAAPPSAHFDADGVQDGVYTWLSDPSQGYDLLPERISSHLAAKRHLEAIAPSKDTSGSVGHVEFDDKGRATWRMWQVWDLSGLQRAIREADDGNQNNIIHWAAMRAAETGVPFDVAMKDLLAAALEGHHPRRRAETSIRSGYRKAAARG
jgi:hypothetical protein